MSDGRARASERETARDSEASGSAVDANRTSATVRRPRWPRRLAIALAVVGIACVAAFFAIRVAIERAVRNAVASAATVTGRRVTVGSIDVTLGRVVVIGLHDLDVAARSSASNHAPLLHVRSLRAAVRPWSLLRSRARTIEIDTVALETPTIDLARASDGTFSASDLIANVRRYLDRNDATHASDRHLRVARFDLRDLSATLTTTNANGAAHTASISRLDATVRDWEPRTAFRVVAHGALSASERNVDVDLSFVAAGPRGAMRVRSVRATCQHVPLDALLALDLGARIPVGSAQLDGTVGVDLREASDAVDVRADLRATDLSLRADDASATVPPRFSASLRLDASVSPGPGDYAVRQLDLTLDGMRLSGSMDLRGATQQPVVHALDVTAHDVRLERIMALLPARFHPSHTSLVGPVDIVASATGSPDDAHLDARVDLAAVSIESRELQKPAGAPFHLAFHGHASPTHIDIERLGVVLGPLQLLLHGSVTWPHAVDLSFDTGAVSLDAMLPFLPGMRRELPHGAALEGIVRIAGQALRASDGDHAHATVTLRAAHVRTPRLALDGDADLQVEARLGHAQLAIRAGLDATRAHVVVPDRFDKPAGLPLLARLDGRRTGHRVHVETASLEIPGARIAASLDADLSTDMFEVRAPLCEIDSTLLATVFPDLTSRMPAALQEARMRFALGFEGNPHALGEASLHVADLQFRAPYGSLRGRFDVVDLIAPRRVDLDLDIDTLDLGEIPVAGTVRPGAHHGPHGPPAWLHDVALDARIRARQLRRGDTLVSDVDAHLTLAHARLESPTMHLRFADGSVDLSGTQWQLEGTHQLVLHARAVRLDVARLGSDPDATRRATGRISVEADLTGSTDGDHAERNFSGTLHALGTEMHVQRVATPTITIAHPLLSHLSLGNRHADTDTPRAPVYVRRLEAGVRVDRGTLRTTTPLVADTDLGTINVTGSIDMGGALDLRGTIQIPPETIRAQSQGRLLPAGPVPVTVHVTGATDEPRVEISDISATLRALSGSGFRALGARLRERFGGH